MNFKKTIFLWAAALLLTTGAFAQVKKKPAPSSAHKAVAAKPQGTTATILLPTDPDVIIGKLPNGLTYYIRANAQPKGKAQLLLIDKAGSVLETDAQRGMATFVQHLAFKGTRDFTEDQITNYLSKLDNKFGPDVNGFTSYDETIYQLALPTDTPKVFANGFNLLANWASRITFDPQAVNSEKTIATANALSGGKTAQDRLQQQALPVLLNNSRYALRLPIGTEGAIKDFNDAAAKSFYTDWYRPDMQAIIAVGDFDPKQVEELIKFNFSALRNPVPEKPLPQYTVPATVGTAVKFATDKEFTYTLVQIIDKHPQTTVKTPADFLQNIRISLFNQLLNTRVTGLTQIPSPPILFGQAVYSDFVGKQDAFTALAVSNGADRLETAVKAIVTETERTRKFGFTITELERAKQNALAQITENYRTKNNIPSANYANDYEHNFLNKQAITGIDYQYNYYINNIGKISLAEMNALAARLISDQNRVILIEAPETEKGKLPNEQTLLKWVAEAGTGLTPYVDDTAEPLMAQQPTPGKAVSVKVDSTLMVTNVTLANGVRIILKPTTFTDNQILFSGYSFGGTSLAGDQDFTSANIAGTVISNSGVANFDQTKLTRMLRDKNLTITPYISDVTQGVSGYVAPDSFESAMQLLHLYFTNPRKDADVWKAYINQTKSALVKNINDPGSAYQDTVIAVLNGYKPRFMPVTAAKLDAASLDKAYDFYKARFADASNFTFTFTGAFTVDAIVPYLELYLGSLPSTHSKETYNDLGIHPPAGQITKTVYKGTSNKATVQLIFNGSYDYSDANNIQMDALEEVLNIKLIDSLDAGSGLLSPGVRASYVKIPEGRYKITVSFLTDVNSVDRSVAYVLNEINKIKQAGPNANYVKRFVITEARSVQGQLKQNPYWLSALTAAAQNFQDPDKILNRPQYLNDVTPQSVKDAANKYLGTNLIKIILLPEAK